MQAPCDNLRRRVAEQLTIFGLWDTVVPLAIETPDPSPAPALPTPIDPRQADLLSGPQSMRAALEAACESLDAIAVRARHAELNQRFLGQRWADHAPDWALGIEWLVGPPSDARSIAEQIDRVLALWDDSAASAHFPELPRYVLVALRAEASRRAALRLAAERGPTALLTNGEPVGWLLLRAGNVADAREQLSAALAALVTVNDGFPAARAWSWLAEAEWLAGDAAAAIRAYCRACLLGGAVTEPEITCESILDLFDTAADLDLPEPITDWVPVLADLRGLVRLGEEATAPPLDAAPARRLAAELAEYRLRRAAGALDEAARIGAKRNMARLAPPSLRELLRKV